MSQLDMPLIIQQVLDVTFYEKVDVVGYSRGNALMFLALSYDEHDLDEGVEFFPYQEKVKRFYAFAPCLPSNLPSGYSIPTTVIGENTGVQTFLYEGEGDNVCFPYWAQTYIVPQLEGNNVLGGYNLYEDTDHYLDTLIPALTDDFLRDIE